MARKIIPLAAIEKGLVLLPFSEANNLGNSDQPVYFAGPVDSQERESSPGFTLFSDGVLVAPANNL